MKPCLIKYFNCLCLSPSPVSSLHGKSSSTGNLLEREDVAVSVPEYAVHSHMAVQSAAPLHGRQQRPYSMVAPGFSQVGLLAPNKDPKVTWGSSIIYPLFFTRHTAHSFGAIRPCLTRKVLLRPSESSVTAKDERHAQIAICSRLKRKRQLNVGPSFCLQLRTFSSYVSP